jgi:hypothetical protein
VVPEEKRTPRQSVGCLLQRLGNPCVEQELPGIDRLPEEGGSDAALGVVGLVLEHDELLHRLREALELLAGACAGHLRGSLEALLPRVRRLHQEASERMENLAHGALVTCHGEGEEEGRLLQVVGGVVRLADEARVELGARGAARQRAHPFDQPIGSPFPLLGIALQAIVHGPRRKRTVDRARQVADRKRVLGSDGEDAVLQGLEPEEEIRPTRR